MLIIVKILKVEASDVGRIYKIRIGHDGTGFGAGWFLETVTVKKLQTLKKVEKPKKKKKRSSEEEEDNEPLVGDVTEIYEFSARRWLAEDEEDKEIVIELTPEKDCELEGKLLAVVCKEFLHLKPLIPKNLRYVNQIDPG